MPRFRPKVPRTWSTRDYQLRPHGRRDEQGYQRYRLPDPKGYIAFDPDTGEIRDAPAIQTVTIPLSVGLRWGQKFPYKTPEWQEAYNLRSGVERKNSQLKHSTYENLNDPHHRPTRGLTATSVDVAMIVCAHNLRAVDNFGRRAENIEFNKTPRRRSRRDEVDVLVDIRKQRDKRTAA